MTKIIRILWKVVVEISSLWPGSLKSLAWGSKILTISQLAWSAPFLKTFENMRKLDFFRLSAPWCASTAAGTGSLKKSNFLMFSKVLRKAPDQANYLTHSTWTQDFVLHVCIWQFTHPFGGNFKKSPTMYLPIMILSITSNFFHSYWPSSPL